MSWRSSPALLPAGSGKLPLACRSERCNAWRVSFRVREQVWDPDNGANADWFHCQTDTVVLLDGAAPQHPQPVSSFDNDAVWLVRRFVEVFSRLSLDRSIPLLERIERAREELDREYRALCGKAGYVPRETPFACLAVAHERSGQIELLNMGDLSVLLRRRGGSVERFGTSAVRDLDGQALALLEREIAAGPATHAERVTNVWPKIQANRALRNVLPGYEVLEPGVSCAGKLERCAFARGEVSSFLMLSDGFYRLDDTFHRYTDASLFDAVEQRGLRELLRELRAVEDDDAECVRHARFKRRDDATALWLE
jgi:hypothetical protein